MANEEHVAQLRKGAVSWNAWRKANPDIRPDLSGANLYEANLRGANLSEANLRGACLSWASLHGANLWKATLVRANLAGAHLMQANLSWATLIEAQLTEADLSEADLRGANLSLAKLSLADFEDADLSSAALPGADLGGAKLDKADLSWADLGQADLSRADLSEANLVGANLAGAYLMHANLQDASLREANFKEADLQGAALLGTNLTDADLTGCRIHGVAAWGLKLMGAKQQNLIITPENEPEITVDNIEVAQFIYLLLNNQKVREVIDTITSKAVLILGRFTEERKAVLDALRDELRNRNLLPILFDFAPSASRDVTETIKTLASLARFVIADVTEATEVRAELHNIVRDFPSLPVQPILLRGHSEFVSLSHLTKLPWVLPIFEYDDPEHLLPAWTSLPPRKRK
jgi:uncharacterized protein YjbI with pentapeptide repeats